MKHGKCMVKFRTRLEEPLQIKPTFFCNHKRINYHCLIDKAILAI